MDFRNRDITWTARADTVFSRGLSNSAESSQKSELKRQLKHLLQRRSRTWWNKTTLEKYLAQGLIPRGLRIQVFPSFPIDSDNFKDQWEAACSTCSKTFLELLVSHNIQTLTSLETEIEELSRKIRLDLSTEELTTWNQEVDSWFKDWEEKIEIVKVKKYQRDLTDLQLNRVYRWRTPQTNLVRTSSISSISSIGASSSTSSSSSQRNKFKKSRRKPEYNQRSNERRFTRQRGDTPAPGPSLK
ncbi:uncharacterized protein LOC130274545 [Hyla sarda]|uniref:uncharacterized protein LOC130274545 n=1 Tax=Hyla sarda TaxID=327740 RepID=UPI0024C32EB2|nr:uncharacterized protein LOC130274545 [Hyla sarda]